MSLVSTVSAGKALAGLFKLGCLVLLTTLPTSYRASILSCSLHQKEKRVRERICWALGVLASQLQHKVCERYAREKKSYLTMHVGLCKMID